MVEFLGRQTLRQLKLEHFVVADDAESQRLGEPEARARVGALRCGDRQVGAAKHALEAVHQVVMTDKAQVARLLEAETIFAPWGGSRHSGGRGRGRFQWFGQHASL